MKLLCLSNGHGEDVIAVRILEQLQHHPDAPELAALPLVGKGHAYAQLNIPKIGPVEQMPSGGFIYMDGRQLWRDIQGGLLQLTLAQYQVIRQWGQTGGAILAVGDIVPLLLAWLSGANYGFVGTAKSEYYLRDETGWLSQTSSIEKALGSVYQPWDRWLMSRPRCQAVFPRDTLTTEILQQWSIPAFDLGNPMMDGIEVGSRKSEVRRENSALTVLLLPGSRMPEAERNWQIIMTAVRGMVDAFEGYSLKFLAAIAPGLNLQPFQDSLQFQGWQEQFSKSVNGHSDASSECCVNFVKMPFADSQALTFTKSSQAPDVQEDAMPEPASGISAVRSGVPMIQKNATLLLSQSAYQDFLLTADLAIAMAGTATEQFVGLGKPVITIPGQGPQFTDAFAEAQTRLLGCSVILVQQPEQVTDIVRSLLSDPQRWQLISENGKRRMGGSGAAKRIADCLIEKLLSPYIS